MPKGKPTVYLCGVPKEKCSGSDCQVSASLGGRKKAHSSSEAAFNCHKAHLLALGFKQLDSRAFSPPDGGEVRVLTKQSKWTSLRSGKEGNRVMPKHSGGLCRGGTIISS